MPAVILKSFLSSSLHKFQCFSNKIHFYSLTFFYLLAINIYEELSQHYEERKMKRMVKVGKVGIEKPFAPSHFHHHHPRYFIKKKKKISSLIKKLFCSLSSVLKQQTYSNTFSFNQFETYFWHRISWWFPSFFLKPIIESIKVLLNIHQKYMKKRFKSQIIVSNFLFCMCDKKYFGFIVLIYEKTFIKNELHELKLTAVFLFFFSFPSKS